MEKLFEKAEGLVAEDHKEMQRRIKETLKILDNIVEKDALENIHDNDVARAIDMLRPRR